MAKTIKADNSIPVDKMPDKSISDKTMKDQTMPDKTISDKTMKDLGNKINGFIGVGVTLTGKLSFTGVLRIDGKFTGDIDSDGILIVGQDACIESTIKVGSAFISGEVKGTVEALTKVELIAPCRIYGDIKTPKLVIHEGAFFEGICGMQGLIDSSLKQLPMDKKK
jgi:cytoskeletal protein CcmA (bactofilin family)